MYEYISFRGLFECIRKGVWYITQKIREDIGVRSNVALEEGKAVLIRGLL